MKQSIINLAKSLLEDEDTACVVYLDQSAYLRFEPAATMNQLTMHYRRCSFKDSRQFESLKKYFCQKLIPFFLFYLTMIVKLFFRLNIALRRCYCIF